MLLAIWRWQVFFDDFLSIIYRRFVSFNRNFVILRLIGILLYCEMGSILLAVGELKVLKTGGL